MTWNVHSEYQNNLPVSIALDNKPTPPSWGQSEIIPKEAVTILANIQEGFSPPLTSSGQFSLPSSAGKGNNVLQKAHSTPGSETQVPQEFLE